MVIKQRSCTSTFIKRNLFLKLVFSFFQIIEILIQEGNNILFRLIRNSEAFRTLIFMVLSATLLDTLSVVKSNIFWYEIIHIYFDDVNFSAYFNYLQVFQATQQKENRS